MVSVMAGEPIISPDTRRQPRLPPGHTPTPILLEPTLGEIPPFDPAHWDLTIFPRPFVSEVKSFTWSQFLSLPRVRVFADMHSIDRQSKLDNLWEGVSTRVIQDQIQLSPEVRFVMVHAEYGYSANMRIEDFFAEDSLLALRLDGRELTPEQGYPVRLVIPRLYSWKSVKWVRGIEFLTEDRPGFWESVPGSQYPFHGDPWTESRFREK